MAKSQRPVGMDKLSSSVVCTRQQYTHFANSSIRKNYSEQCALTILREHMPLNTVV